MRPPLEACEALRRPQIRIGRSDHRRLQQLAFGALLSRPRIAGPLLQELDRATVLADHAVPADVVRIGSWVTYAVAQDAGPRQVKLVCAAPDNAPGTLSALTTTGAALIGLRVGQSILWADHVGGDRLITVRDVAHAPRAVQ